MKSKNPILVIGDLHAPAIHHESLEKMFEIVEGMNIKHVVQLGDIYDQYSQSSFSKKMIITPKEETEISRVMAEEFWQRMHKLFPKAKKYQFVGNHGKPRIIKKMMAAAPECLHFLSIDALWEFEGVQTVPDYTDYLQIEGIYFTHGFSCRPGFHRDYFQDNVVNCHTHRPHILPKKLKDRTITEFNVGYLADPFHPFLQYTAMKKVTHWMHSFGIIDEYGPKLYLL